MSNSSSGPISHMGLTGNSHMGLTGNSHVGLTGISHTATNNTSSSSSQVAVNPICDTARTDFAEHTDRTRRLVRMSSEQALQCFLSGTDNVRDQNSG